jgi:hypothetical protein
MDLYQAAILVALFGAGLWHHGRHSYRKGREEGTNEAVNIVLAILTVKGIITVDEAEDIIRNDEAKID